MFNKCTALIVDPNNSSRLKLKHAAEESGLFESIVTHEELSRAQMCFLEDRGIDITFVSGAFPVADSGDFLQKTRTMGGGKSTIFIHVVQVAADATVVSRHVAVGFSGFLVEPYSLDALTGIVALVQRLKLQLSETKDDAVLMLLLKEILFEVDIMHALTKAKIEPKQSRKALLDSCGVLRGLPKSQLERFYELAEKFLDEAIPPTLLPPGYTYTGTSKRVPIQVERDLLKKLSEFLKVPSSPV